MPRTRTDAMLAPAPDTFGTLLWPVAALEAPPPSPVAAPPTLLRSIMPALDLAFGLSDLSDVPDALAMLIARLAAPEVLIGGDTAALPLADAA